MSRRRKTLKKQKLLLTTPKWHWFALTTIVVGAFLLRIFGQWDRVFVGNNVWFRGVDSWYHMRLADATNFPDWIKWDMFAQYPNGAYNGYMPLLAWLSINETVGVLLPPILGAITLVPIYLIGKHVFSSKVGLLATLLVAVIPGEFLHRTLLGFTDHHVLEVLFMTSSIYFLLRLRETWQTKWAILLGVSIGLYTLSWTGVAFFLMIVGIWLWWECLQRLRTEESYLPVVRAFVIVAGIAGLISFQWAEKVTLLILVGLFIVPLTMWLLTSLTKDKEKIVFGLTVVIPIGLVILGAFINYRDFIIPIFWGGNTYIEEATPLTLHIILATYGMAFFMMIGGLYFYRKVNPLFIIWCIILIAAALGQRRWGYYTVVPVSLLTAAFIAKITTWVAPTVRGGIVTVIVLFLLLPNIQGTIGIAKMPSTINADWYVALSWLKDNSEPPFVEGEEAYYLTQTKKPQYGVLSWWDYGHWIIRIAHRVPLDSPTQSGGIASQFFTSSNEETANSWLKGSVKYVIIDSTLLTTKWYAVLQRAEKKEYIPVENTFLFTLWNDQAETWTNVYRRGGIKIYESTK